MSTKNLILKALEEKRGQFVSGAELAETIGISRNAVWKGVAVLRADGVSIEAVSSVGYRLSPTADVTMQGIGKYIDGDWADIRLHKSVTSTNNVARQLATDGAKEGTVAVALEQSAGRGRLGRKFYSPKGAGVYFSIVLRPTMEVAGMLTVLAAVAVAEGIELAGGKPTQIKWVNDVFVDGKKCCGILTEAVTDMESGGIEYAVVGIGINVYTPQGGFDNEIKDIAAAACDGVDDGPNRVIACVLNRLWQLYTHFDRQDIAARYKSKSFLTGKDVTVVKGDVESAAMVLDIDDMCRLVVRYEDKTEEALSSGEVKIKW